MNLAYGPLQRFLFSHHFYSGVRRAAGILLPIALLGGVFGWYASGLIATFGALCVAFIDQPGPHEHRAREMLGGTVLSTLTVTLTGLASSDPLLSSVVVMGQCFAFSMLAVYGKKGGQIGFACLLLMTVTLHNALSTQEVWVHALTSLGGGLFYTLFSYSVSRVMQLREKEQALSVALFATADYIARRADMYDLDRDLDESYRKLIVCQADMTDKHQAARDMVLRGLATPKAQSDSNRVMLWNLFVEMMALLDLLVATRTDYAFLRQKLAGADALLFMRDALHKMAGDLERIALALARENTATQRSSVKAELRALEFEIHQMHTDGVAQRDPELYALCVEILRRLRNSAKVIDRMIVATQRNRDAQLLDTVKIDRSLTQFLSRQQFRPRLITSNLRLDSPFCRYALRVTLAAGIALALSALIPALARQGYWILLTVLIIMKPGFALTRQRNGWRLLGTLVGCGLAFALLYTTQHETWLFAAMVLSTIIGGSLLQINYLVASIFNTNAVLLAFNFLDPGATTIITDRAVDTLLGSVIAFACSYVLPWWEAQFMPSLMRAAISANREYLRAALAQIQAREAHASESEVKRADFNLRLARKNVHVALANFAEAFYRMMLEPKSRQWHVIELNNIVIQNHMLSSQISAVATVLMSSPNIPEASTEFLNALLAQLLPAPEHPTPTVPKSLLDGTLPELTYPLKQLQRSIALMNEEITVIYDQSQVKSGVTETIAAPASLSQS
ncbi:MAG: hypothetical protein RLZZ481_523 [Pseudomonadota bacterium]